MHENISTIDYKEVIEYALEPLLIHSQLKIIYVNQAAEAFFRNSKKEILKASPLDIFQESSKSAITKRIENAYEQPANVIEETIYRMDGTTVDVELYCHPVMIGNTKAIQTYVRDVTEKKAAENNQKKIISQINELSSTLVPLMNGIAVLPLLGAFDEDRAKQVLENVPVNVQKQNIKCLIIDFSAIYELDAIVADYIFRINAVLSLLGVHAIITGLRPELALVAVQSGINFGSTPTLPTVKDALYFLGVEHNKNSSAYIINQ